jgi:penicillin amidase
MRLQAPVAILRDARGIPHIRAGSLHDAFFAQGYVEASDRLFQIDLSRMHVYGRLAEWFGKAALDHDVRARDFDVNAVIARQYAALASNDRDVLPAFADGVNAAIEREPLPVEYRLLFLRPDKFRPQDALAAGFATVIDLTDDWYDVIERDRVFRRFGDAGSRALYPLTDPRYDAPTTAGAPAPLPSLSPLPPRPQRSATPSGDTKEGRGSNDWAAGGALTRDGRALVANDPHLRVGIPGVWYLVDIEAPGFHVAGASLAGTPGVILGHNERVAWGVTNGTVVSDSIYETSKTVARRHERFFVRFGATVERDYEEDVHGFVVRDKFAPHRRFAVDWEPARSPKNPLTAFMGLDRARSVEDALAALRAHPGPPQNFVLADAGGRVAYHLSGDVPNDPYWGLRAHAARDPHYAPLAFDALPAVAASRSALAFTANNRMYGRDYRLRLSPGFAPPYRAFEIRAVLQKRARYSLDDFAAMQRDTLSVAERELARAAVLAAQRRGGERNAATAEALSELERWDGRFEPSSRAASVAAALRLAALGRFAAGFFYKDEAAAYGTSANGQFAALLRALRERPRGYVAGDDYDGLLLDALSEAARAARPWSGAGEVAVRHPLAALGLHWFDAPAMPGNGDAYAVRVQKRSGAQSFRAVWDVGAWDNGGIVIPDGESGRPGSAHYTDLSATWLRGDVVPLPFSRGAVEAAARRRLDLVP